MAKVEYLGEFEQLVMWTVVRLRDNAYGMTIRRDLSERTGRQVSIGAVYATLERLEEKGLVRFARRALERGSRARKFFRVTASGVLALSESRRIILKSWRGLQPAVVRG